MARIRTIKPEFPQSESMGRVSRDARLTFIMLWTIADDSGRLRGNSRMLASLLFPYDDDARKHIDGWLKELENEGCITRYAVEGDTYLQVNGWANHQKIDKPSASKIPPPPEPSRALANPRESSPLDQGSRTKDQGEDQGESADEPRPRPLRKCPDSFVVTEELREWARQNEPSLTPAGLDRETAKFRDYTYSRTISDWPAAWRNWIRKSMEGRTPAAAEPAWRAEQRQRTQLAAPGVAAGGVAAADFFDVEARPITPALGVAK